MKYSHKDYYDAVNELIDKITKKYKDKICAIYAGGSFARGDFVPGRSDIDLYIVVEGREEQFQKDLQNAVSKIEKKYFKELSPVFGKVLDKVYKLIPNLEKKFKWLKWIPFKLVSNKNKLRWTRLSFCLIFRTAAVFLGSKGISVSKKEDIVSTFTRHIKEKKLCEIISNALLLWEKWKTESLKDKEVKKLIRNSLRFVKELQKFLDNSQF